MAPPHFLQRQSDEEEQQPTTTPGAGAGAGVLPLPPNRYRGSSPSYESFYSPSSAFYSPVSAASPILQSPVLSRIKRISIGRRNPSPKEADTVHSESNLNPNIILHEPRRTHPVIWCVAVVCLLFILLLILVAISTLIVFLAIRPKHPSFDIPNANLNTIYFDEPDTFNGDFTLLANFTNPNKKINLRFKSVDFDLIFSDRVICTQSIPPFELRRGGRVGRWEVVRMVSSLVRLPREEAGELRRNVESGKVAYAVKGRFRVEATVAAVGDWCRFSYWQKAMCQLVVTAPPTGVLVTRSCSATKK